MEQNPARAMIAMSGGVDSAVAALLMRQAGYDCVGATMRLYRDPGYQTACERRCCSDTDEEDAAFVCAELGIPHESVCLTKRFAAQVIDPFVSEYTAGRTPNPCIDCNRYLKFDALLAHALSEGCPVLATGHYARVTRDARTGRYQLRKALDGAKDQSYVLYMLTQAQLAHLRFPLGELRKTEVRALAEKHGLVIAKKRDSQDICFVPDGDCGAFIERWTGVKSPPGDILDARGRVVGRHAGLTRYTVGQRRGLGLAMGEPVYVRAKDAARNALIVGPRRELLCREIEAEGVCWLSVPEPPGPIRAAVRTRYHQPEQPASVYPLGQGRARIVFDVPQSAPAPGQAAVFYDGELVLGGGTIT